MSVRHIDTKYVVGVMMDVFHPALIEPTTSNKSPTVYQTHSFIYDLELDEHLSIIGGEWYSEDQPDFIWTMEDDSQSQVREDLNPLPVWDTNLPMPPDTALVAVSAASRGKVMATIIEKLRLKSLE